MKENIVISLGGSVVVPEKINTDFLRVFKSLIIRSLPEKRFFIVVGGGKIAREYQKAVTQVSKVDNEDSDWIGIHATRLNAQLLRTIFKEYAYGEVLTDPTEKPNFKESILVAGGWKPGFSTDYDAVLIARNYGAKKIINVTSTDFVYDKDPKKYPHAKPIRIISWKNFRKIVGTKWSPGLNAPFDPVASKLAQELKMKVIITGPKINNLEKVLEGEDFEGTLIS